MAIRMTRTFPPHFLAAAMLLVGAAKAEAQLPPPEVKLAPPVKEQPPVLGVFHPEADRRLKLAFGADNGVLKLAFRIWLADEKIVLAASDLIIEKDNRVYAKDLCIAFFRNCKDDQFEVKTLGSLKAAVLRIDRSISSPGELVKCKILAIEGVEIPDGSLSNIDLGVGVQLRFKFNIDPKTPINELVPGPKRIETPLSDWMNEDLAKTPELSFGEPVSSRLSKDKALEATAHILAKINHVNQKKTDGFMLALLEKRTDLRTLPVLMGEACRTREEQAKVFAFVADGFRQILQDAKNSGKAPADGNDEFLTKLAQFNLIGLLPPAKLGVPPASVDQVQRAIVAAVVQILMPESESFRVGLARLLATIPNIEATKALARLALFAPEDAVRTAAIDGLKTRRERDYADVLLQGFGYPLPAVSKRAAEALVKLERSDLLPNLVEVLERPDPRLPLTAKRNGKDVTTVRELVRVNHHRNCLLCHAPGNTENTPEGVLTVAVPLPTEPLPKLAQGGYQSTPPLSPDIVVRIDMTYLRQDFSLMMPVADPHPWPEMQRFDFLVRTRELTPAEAKAHDPCCEVAEPGRLSPYHRAALFALRELTGRDTEPTAAAWRKLLKLPARQ